MQTTKQQFPDARPFRRVGVLMGGPSSEREVSLRSGAAVAKGLRAAGYEVAEVDVKARALDLPAGIEAAFVALHGEFGEDGAIQSLLRDRGVPYTGSGPEASRRAFDKLLTKEIFLKAGVPTPRHEILRAGDRRTLPLPVVVKPLRQGSSIGVFRVTDEADWAECLAEVLKFGPEALVEEFIPGSELTAGVVGEQALPLVEIRAPQGLYDFRAKYTAGMTQYFCPAPVAPAVTAECQRLALAAFRALGCEDLGRVDFRLTPEGRLSALEMNNLPGFTETSLLPKAAAAAGIAFPELCDRIMRRARVK